jgi:hypothetical protein
LVLPFDTGMLNDDEFSSGAESVYVHSMVSSIPASTSKSIMIPYHYIRFG